MTENFIHYNPHTGEILKKEFILTMNSSATKLAHIIDVKPTILYDIINGKKSIDNDIDMKLCHYFALSQGYFLRLQQDYQRREKLSHVKPSRVRADKGLMRAGERLNQHPA